MLALAPIHSVQIPLTRPNKKDKTVDNEGREGGAKANKKFPLPLFQHHSYPFHHVSKKTKQNKKTRLNALFRKQNKKRKDNTSMSPQSVNEE